MHVWRAMHARALSLMRCCGQVGVTGTTVLQTAVEGGHADVVRVVCACGGDALDMPSAVTHARQHGQEQIARILVYMVMCP